MSTRTLTDRLSLRQLLTLPYVGLVLALLLMMGALSWRAGSDTVDTLSRQLLAEAVDRISASLARHVGGADAVLETAFPSGLSVQPDVTHELETLRERFWLATAKDIIGRTATLELRMVDDSAEALEALKGNGPVPFGTERFIDRGFGPIIVKRQVILTGDNLNDAQPGFDENHNPAVHLTVDAKGARVMKETSRENIGKRMAILLFEKGKGEVVTAPKINSELGNRFQISGAMTTQEASDTALLLRAGSLAAPMEIIEERTIGPSLGKENIEKGIASVTWGFAAVAAFMCVYYLLFGVFSSLALGFNLLLLVAALSLMQATLSLPGIAAIALVLGMAIDSNVLINERVREELRGGASPQQAIHLGYERAWATILDSNVTTLIAGVALLVFGSGPIKGFAVVHCLGILTSMFSSVVFSRGLVNLWYGRQKKLKSVSIGQVWKPEADTNEVAKA